VAVLAAADQATCLKWMLASGWCVVFVTLVFILHFRCHAPECSWLDGMLSITGYMMTGWETSTFFVLIIALPVSFFWSLGIAVASFIHRDAKRTAISFRRMIWFFYRHRMVRGE
jgi:hypothetical protein